MQLELEVWREACRHIEIEEFVARISPLLARGLPLSRVVVRRLDLVRSRLETVAQSGPSSASMRSELAPEELGLLRAWFARGVLDHGPFGGASAGRVAIPGDAAGDVIVGPLASEEGPQGVLVLVARAAERFGAEDVAFARRLLEPFTAALANDRRFHELARLREAAEAENRALLSRLGRQSLVESIVGEGSGLRSVMERVEQVARTEVPVLLLGETGSGKEVIARAIHERSRRATGPIVRVNCGAIPTELVDSELFGHEKGSFTGAVAQRKGWFERADGGTLFLDEVAELPLAAQVRLLRVLQDGMLERVGGQRTIAVDVRIVAATHRDLHQMVAEGRFREDLWYRISVFPLRLPPLRERVEDIPALAAHFAGKAGERLGGHPLVPSETDLAILSAYPWPGNVRELAAVIERAAILGHGRKLEMAAALGATVARPSLAPLTPVPPAMPSIAPRRDDATLDRAMAQHIEETLAATRGRIEGPRGAAARLGINPHTLRSRMRKLGIEWSRFRE